MTETVSDVAHEPVVSIVDAARPGVGAVADDGPADVGAPSRALPGLALPPQPPNRTTGLPAMAGSQNPSRIGTLRRRTVDDRPAGYSIVMRAFQGPRIELREVSPQEALDALKRFSQRVWQRLAISQQTHAELAHLRNEQPVVAWLSEGLSGAEFPDVTIWAGVDAALDEAGKALRSGDVNAAGAALTRAVEEWKAADEKLDSYRDEADRGAERAVFGLQVTEAFGAAAAGVATGGLATGALASAGVASATAAVYGGVQASAGQVAERVTGTREQFDWAAVFKRSATDAATGFVGAVVGGAITKRLMQSLGSYLKASPELLAEFGESLGELGPLTPEAFVTKGQKVVVEILGGAASVPFTTAVSEVMTRIMEPGKPVPSSEQLLSEVAQAIVQGAVWQLLLAGAHATARPPGTSAANASMRQAPKTAGTAATLEPTAAPEPPAVPERIKPLGGQTSSVPEQAPAAVAEPASAPEQSSATNGASPAPGPILSALELETIPGISPDEVAVLSRIDEARWARLKAYATPKSKRDSVKGKIAEALIPHAEWFRAIHQRAIATAVSEGIPAELVRFETDLKGLTLTQKGRAGVGELCDGAFIAEYNGRLRIFTVFESKSPTNARHLSRAKGEFLGQFGTDFERATNLPTTVGANTYEPEAVDISRHRSEWVAVLPPDVAMDTPKGEQTGAKASGEETPYLDHLKTGFPQVEFHAGAVTDPVLKVVASRLKSIPASTD